MSFRASALILLSLVPMACRAAEPYAGREEIEKLARAMAEKLAARGGGAVAIAPMSNQALERTKLASFLEPDFLRSFKDSRPDLQVVGQSLFASILKQHKIEIAGLASPKKLEAAGKFLSTKILVQVVVEALPEHFLVRAVASDTQTAEFLASGEALLPRSDVLVSRLTAKERRALEPRSVPQAKKSSPKILYELVDCRRRARKVTCTMVLTSQKGDQRVRLETRDTYAIDSQGERHPVKQFNTGKQRGWKLLLPGMPARIEMELDKIPKEVDLFRTLKLGGKELDAKFSQVRISG